MKNKIDMEKNKMNEADLEQISGGKSLWDVFTAEFKTFEAPRKKGFTLEEKEDEELLGVHTLEMRDNVMKKKDSKKVVKL